MKQFLKWLKAEFSGLKYGEEYIKKETIPLDGITSAQEREILIDAYRITVDKFKELQAESRRRDKLNTKIKSAMCDKFESVVMAQAREIASLHVLIAKSDEESKKMKPSKQKCLEMWEWTEEELKDICLNCGKELESELWGDECQCGKSNIVHQVKCNGCGLIIGQITGDDYCCPEKLYCPVCVDKARVGDTATSITAGEGVIKKTNPQLAYPILVEFDHTTRGYTLEGKLDPGDSNPEIIKWTPKQRKWEPSIKGEKHYVIYADGDVDSAYHDKITGTYLKEGRVYETYEAAQAAYKIIRETQITARYVYEFKDGWVADWSNRELKYSIQFNVDIKKYIYHYSSWIRVLGVVYMSLACAEQLVKDLNNHVVEL